MSTIYLIESRIAEVDRGCGDPRSAELGRAIAALPDTRVVWLAADRSGRNVYAPRLESWGIEVASEAPARVLEFGDPADVVVITRPENFLGFADLVERHQPDALKVFDFESLFHLRFERSLAAYPKRERPAIAARLDRTRVAERNAVHWADRVICVSDAVARFVTSVDPAVPVAIAGYPVPVVEPVPGLDVRRGVTFLGSFRTGLAGPNGDALCRIVDDLQPRLGVDVVIAGADIDAQVRDRASEATPVVGAVPDVPMFLGGFRVLLCPVFVAAGISLRLMEAAAVGTPFVTTPAVAEGLDLPVELSRHLVGNSNDELVAATQRLLDDDDLWSMVSAGLVALARSRWNRDHFDAAVASALAPLPNAAPSQ